MNKITKVEFPQGNLFEGSPCIIHYSDGRKEKTIADTAYMRAHQLKMTKDEMKAAGL